MRNEYKLLLGYGIATNCPVTMNMCREDLNYACLQFNQCGRKFI